MKKPFFILVVALSAIMFTGCSFGNFFQDAVMKIGGKLPTKNMSFTTTTQIVKLNVEIASSKSDREKGLMKRDKLEAGKGMWFVFEDEAPRVFWMKNTLIPLDVIFFDNKKQVVSIVEYMNPCVEKQGATRAGVCPGYTSKVPAMYALEVPAGFVQEKSVKIGDVIAEDK